MTARVSACEVPEGSLLAAYGGPGDYRDCFVREVPGEVSLAQYIERFYSSMVFAPERMVLGLIGRGASAEDISALARSEADRIMVWEVIERRSAASGPQGQPPARSDATEGRESEESIRGRMVPPAPEAKTYNSDQILLLSKDTNTASWLSTQPSGANTKLLFGSWVGGIEESRWKFMLQPHVWYSRALLGGC